LPHFLTNRSFYHKRMMKWFELEKLDYVNLTYKLRQQRALTNEF